MNRHFICFCIWIKAELRNIRLKFSTAILAAILENIQLLLLISTYLNSMSFISYESTLYLSLYLTRELRYIRFRISAAMLAAIFEKNIFINFQISDHICDIPVKFGWKIHHRFEVITISFWGLKITPKWPSCNFFGIWPTRVNRGSCNLCYPAEQWTDIPTRTGHSGF